MKYVACAVSGADVQKLMAEDGYPALDDQMADAIAQQVAGRLLERMKDGDAFYYEISSAIDEVCESCGIVAADRDER